MERSSLLHRHWTDCCYDFNFVHNVIQYLFLVVHLVYSKTRGAILRLFSIVGSLVALTSATGPLVACFSTFKDSCETFTIDWLGGVNVLVYSMVYCGQLWTLRSVIKTRNSGSISPWLTAGVTFCTMMWTCYAGLVPDYFYLGSSVIGDLSALTQIFLLVKYPRILRTPDNAIPNSEAL